jgi:serine/threonine protein kinase
LESVLRLIINKGQDILKRISQIQPGQYLLERYYIEKFLGEGGMGQVFLCYDLIREAQYALKIIHSHLAHIEDIRRRFIQELKVTELLTHRGIVRTYNLEHHPASNLLFFTMEYVEGNTLEIILQRAKIHNKKPPIKFPQTLAVIKELCNILNYAHSQGVIHRDIKPPNVMITKSGHVKLMDFGIAKLLTNEANVKHTGFQGIVYYMAPEQLQGGQLVTPSADVFSLGVLCYQLLTGEIPIGSIPPPPSFHVPSLTIAIDSVIMKAISLEPQDRYSTPQEMWEALSNAIQTSYFYKPFAFSALDKNPHSTPINTSSPNYESYNDRVLGALGTTYLVSGTKVEFSESISSLNVDLGQTDVELPISSAELSATKNSDNQPKPSDEHKPVLGSIEADLPQVDRAKPKPISYGFPNYQEKEYPLVGRTAQNIATHDSMFSQPANPEVESYTSLSQNISNSPFTDIDVPLVQKTAQKSASTSDNQQLADTTGSTRPHKKTPPVLTIYRPNQDLSNQKDAVYSPIHRQKTPMPITTQLMKEEAHRYPSGDQPAPQIPRTRTPSGDQPAPQIPRTRTPSGDQPAPQMPQTRNPSGDQPAPQIPRTRTPSGEPACTPSGDKLQLFKSSSEQKRPFMSHVAHNFDDLPAVPAHLEENIFYSRNNEMLLPFVKIPAGTFLMGSDTTDAMYRTNELPKCRIRMDSYWISRIPVTNRVWQIFVEESGYKCDEPDYLQHWMNGQPPIDLLDHPVIYIAYRDAQYFCAFYGLAIPTEAQWERAARGDFGYIWPWGNKFLTSPYCNCRETKLKHTTSVLAYPKGTSSYGLLDCSGNVWEWCADEWQRDFFKHLGQSPTNPGYGLESNRYHVPHAIRGGCFDNHADGVRCAVRDKSLQRSRYIGMRVIMPTRK